MSLKTTLQRETRFLKSLTLRVGRRDHELLLGDSDLLFSHERHVVFLLCVWNPKWWALCARPLCGSCPG